MTARVVIWLDDRRGPWSGAWLDYITAHEGEVAIWWAKNAEEFKPLFEAAVDADVELAAIFFDNDLGTPAEGRDVFRWVERQVRERDIEPFELYAQTANPAARKALLLGFGALRRFWAETGGPLIQRRLRELETIRVPAYFRRPRPEFLKQAGPFIKELVAAANVRRPHDIKMAKIRSGR